MAENADEKKVTEDGVATTAPSRGGIAASASTSAPSASARFAHDVFETLGSAPPSALIHVIMEYHRMLLDLGKDKEASEVMDSVAALMAPVKERAEADDLHGADLLFKHGLLPLLLKINQHLPAMLSQIVTFKNLTYGIERVVPEGIESVGQKLGDIARGPLKKKPKVVNVNVLSNVSGYLMPGAFTLILGPPGCGKSTLLKLLCGRLDADKLPARNDDGTNDGDDDDVDYNGPIDVESPEGGEGSQQKGKKKEKAGGPVRISGDICYNKRPLRDIVPSRLAGVAERVDYHSPFLTVKETLEFARNCGQVWTYKDYGPEMKEIMGEALKMGQDPKIEMVMRMMRLTRAANLPVGNPMIPTTSAAERRRLTAGELLATILPVMVFDDLNAGGDNAVTYQLLQDLRVYTVVRQVTVAATLQQPPPRVFDLFDFIIVLDHGRVVFQGPRADAVAHFSRLGYVKPSHVEEAEFLAEVTTEEGSQYLQAGHEVLSLGGFVSAYEESPFHRDVMRVVDSPDMLQQIFVKVPQPLGLTLSDGPKIADISADSSLAHVDLSNTAVPAVGDEVVAVAGGVGKGLEFVVGQPAEQVQAKLGSLKDPARLQLQRTYVESEPAMKQKQFQQEYLRTFSAEFKELFFRFLTLYRRNKFMMFARIFQVVVLALFSGMLFFQAPADASSLNLNIRRGTCFISMMTNTLMSLGHAPQHFEDRLVFYKHTAMKFYRPVSYWLAGFLAGILFNLAEATIWSLIFYFLTGMSVADYGWHFFVYWGIICLTSVQAFSMVRAISYLAPDREAANAMLGMLIALFVLFAGFVYSRVLIPGWWIWMFYIDPLAQGVTALLANEFISSSFSTPCSSIPPSQLPQITQCINMGDTPLGQAFLSRNYFFYQPAYIGIGAAVLVGWICIWNAVALLAMSKVRHRPPTDEGQAPADAEIGKRLEAAVMQKEDDEFAASAARRSADISRTATPATTEGTALIKSSEAKGSEKGGEEKSEEGRGGATGEAVFTCGAPPTDFYLPTHGVPVTPVVLSWHDLGYEVHSGGEASEAKWLIKGVSGWVKPGEVLAIVGFSGSGKTTLLNALAGRHVDPDAIMGSIRVNGQLKEQHTFARVVGYVDKDEAYLPYMTVREVLEFSAALRIGQLVTAEQRRAVVDETLEMLELSQVSSRLLLSLRGPMAVEHSKRVGIAAEVAANASILFLDDPTAGMDSREAWHIFKCIRNIAATGRAVIASTRLPTTRVASLFDSTLLLKRGGQCVYFGATGPCGMNIQAYFESIPGVPPCPPGTNPCSYAINVIGDGISAPVGPPRDFGFEYEVSSIALENAKQLKLMLRGEGPVAGLPALTESGYAASYWTQAKEVFVRMHRFYWRNWHYSFSRLMSSVIIGLIMGSLFWQVNITTVPGMSGSAGLIFASCLLMAISNAQNVVPLVAMTAPSFIRERSTKHYLIAFYNLAWSFAEVPYLAVATLIFCAISCTMSGVATSSAALFFNYWFILFELVTGITFAGMLIAVAVPMPPAASVLVSMLISIWIPTGGLVLVYQKFTAGFYWLYWTNPLQYALNAMTSITFYCNTKSPQCTNNGANQACLIDPSACPQCTCPRLTDARNQFVWNTIEQARSLNYDNVGLYMGVLFIFIFVFRALAFFALLKLKHNRRN